MSPSLSKSCIYTIRHSGTLSQAQIEGGAGIFTEDVKWVTGYKIFQEAGSKNLKVPVLFAYAENPSSGVHYWALIQKVYRNGPSTTIEYSELRRLEKPIALHQLRKLSDSIPLSESHIHPYVPCYTPRGLAARKIASPRLDIAQSSFPFQVGAHYTRAEVAAVIDLPASKARGGDWATGYTFQNGAWFIFSSVGIPGRTGHDYQNEFDGADFIWWGKSKTRLNQTQISNLLSGKHPVYIFARSEERGSFRFLGVGAATDVRDGPPVRATWVFSSPSGNSLPPEANPESEEFREQVRKRRRKGFDTPPQGTLNPERKVASGKAYVRDPAVVAFVELEAGGLCEKCGQEAPFIRSDGSPFLEVHHIQSLADGGPDTVWNAAGLCPNCHRECHYGQNIAKLRKELAAKILKKRPKSLTLLIHAK
jgi:hypothetical protein